MNSSPLSDMPTEAVSGSELWPDPQDRRDGRPNILLIITDQERQRDWIPEGFDLPSRQKLLDRGLEFTRYHTHTSPCSPSRASMLTGLYAPVHGVEENVTYAGQHELSSELPTIASVLSEAGYSCAYIGKWHLSQDDDVDLRSFGFQRVSGSDRKFYGIAGAGARWDPQIAQDAASWIAESAGSPTPWFLVISLINPHDVMWYPADHAEYQQAHPDEMDQRRAKLPDWVKDLGPDPFPKASSYPRVVECLPDNFDDDLFTKPTVQREYKYLLDAKAGTIDRDDREAWIRQLDYYLHLHRESDDALGIILDAVDSMNTWDSTAVFFTSDHGDMCGSHGLRSKGPFVYDEVMRVPLYAHVPGQTTAGTTTSALATQVDLARTILSIGGASEESMQGKDLTPILGEPSTEVRDSVLFSLRMPWHSTLQRHRYAIRGIFDGEFKYARYFGVGGGRCSRSTGFRAWRDADRTRCTVRGPRPRILQPARGSRGVGQSREPA